MTAEDNRRLTGSDMRVVVMRAPLGELCMANGLPKPGVDAEALEAREEIHDVALQMPSPIPPGSVRSESSNRVHEY